MAIGTIWCGAETEGFEVKGCSYVGLWCHDAAGKDGKKKRDGVGGRRGKKEENIDAIYF